MPMNTTFVRRFPSAARRRAAWRTWSTISAVSRSRISPTRMTSGSCRTMWRRPVAKLRPIFGFTAISAQAAQDEERLQELGSKPLRREGQREGRWVLLDFIDVVVHVQHAEERAYYSLERLWKDCPTIPFTDSSLPPGAALTEGTAEDAGAADDDVPDGDTADVTPHAGR